MEVFFFNFIGHLAGVTDPGGVFPDLNPGPNLSFKKKPNRIEKQPGPGSDLIMFHPLLFRCKSQYKLINLINTLIITFEFDLKMILNLDV